MVGKGKLNALQEKDKLDEPVRNYLGQSEAKSNKTDKPLKESIQKKDMNEYL